MSIDKITHAFAQPGDHNIIDAVHPATKRGVWSGETLTEIRQRYPRAEIVKLDQWQADKAARQDTPVTWDATTADEFEEMLSCLPPSYMRGGVFAVGEPSDHHATSGLPRYQAYKHTAEGFFRSSRPVTVKELAGLR